MPTTTSCGAGAFAVDFTGDVLAEVGNVNFKQLKYDVIATGWRQPGSTFKIFTYGGLVEQLTNEVLADKSAPGTVEAIAAKVLERCSVLDAPIEVPLGRGRGVKKIENFHSRSEPQYRGVISCRIALGESRNTAAMRAGACRDQERDRAHVSPGNAQRREAPPAALPDDRNRRIRGQSAVDGVDDGLLSTVGFA